MRNAALHAALEAFTIDAAACLAGLTASGEEIPFEVVGTERGRRRARPPLYCYRPLTGAFISERIRLLSALASYAPAVRALQAVGGSDAYARRWGEPVAPLPAREQADVALRCFLARVYEERSAFEFEADRFELAYDELERTVYAERSVVLVVATLHGIALDPQTSEIELGDGLSLYRAGALEGAPPDAVWGERALPDPAGGLLAVLRLTQERSSPAPTPTPAAAARARLRGALATLRLFERGARTLGPLAWMQIDAGVWRPLALGTVGAAGPAVVIGASQEDELRAFYRLMSRRHAFGGAAGGTAGTPDARHPQAQQQPQPQPDTSGRGELAWALARFEMGCERRAPFEALSDYLLALRALLEPEGPASGRLGPRLAAICAGAQERAALAQRTAQAASFERLVIAGIAPAGGGLDALVAELAEHLRAILRDVICGHLDPDLRALADELLAEAVPETGLEPAEPLAVHP